LLGYNRFLKNVSGYWKRPGIFVRKRVGILNRGDCHTCVRELMTGFHLPLV